MYLHDGVPPMFGWSGYEDGINVPGMQSLHGVGPIPRGLWVIEGPPFDDPKMGKFVLRLTPAVGTDTCGRYGFFIHDWSTAHPFISSEGCIATLEADRKIVWASGDREWKVTF
jgi:hypothetical protein